MRTSRRILGGIAWALVTCLVTVSGVSATPYVVHFKSGAVTPPAAVYEKPASAIGAVTTNRVHVLLQLEEYIGAGDRARLENAGIQLLSYFPDRAYAASIPTDLDMSGLAALGVRHVSPLHAEYKLSPRVSDQRFGPWSAYKDGRRILAVEIQPDVKLDDAAAILTDAGCEVGHRFVGAHTLLVAIDPAKAYEIASLDVVGFIDESPPPMDTVNDVVRQRLHVNEVQTAPHNLSGDGVTILVYDGGMVDSTHPDFGDRVHWNETATVGDHPTHVAGTVGGDGTNSGGNYRGMAPAATIISGQYDLCVPYCLYESPNDFEADYSRARSVFGIELTTNSIGANVSSNGYDCEWLGDYETTSRLLDGFARNLLGTPLIMCFAAGNERNDPGCAMTSYRCISVPAGAKNIITCGASTSTDASASFTSWGPTDDGRIKPEVMATGVSVTSTLPGGGYGDMDGTSMATPATSGTVCLLLQRWHQLFPGAPDPLPETMKAILINSTTDNGPIGVDYQTGFGMVNALEAVQNMNLGGILESSLEAGETFTRSFTVPANLGVLDISIAWSDVPAAGNVIPTLVNDLDLRLHDPSGAEHMPWRLLSTNPGSPAGRGDDSINVCERVNVPSPVAGQWTLTVTGNLNGSESQTFGMCGNVTLTGVWASISGQVRNANNAQGIPGRVDVVGEGVADLTDASGNYLISAAGNTTYNVHAVAYGFVPQQQSVTVTNGNTTANFSLSTAQNGTLNGTVTNQFNTPLQGAVISYVFPNATIANDTTNATGQFTRALPGANSYEVRASFGASSISATLVIPEGGQINHSFVINDPRYAPAGPDNYGYLAYEINDPGLSAEYDWLEISPTIGGPGTAIGPAAGNDWVLDITAPFAVSFYGESSTTLRVSADGWVQVGAGANGAQPYANQPIPAAGDPNAIICVFWDDLYPYDPANGGDISSYYDVANGRFIIEYRVVPHFAPRTNTTTAQLVIYSQAVRPTVTGDNELILQYQDLDYEDGSDIDADATVGIESPAGDDGIQIVYGGGYNPNCFPLSAGYALRFTTGAIAGYGVVRGDVEMVPAIGDITQVVVQFGQYSVNPAADGSFFADSVVASTYDLTVTYAGYETGSAVDMIVAPDDTLTLDFELYRLDPARSLVGEYDWTGPEIRLNWLPALSAGMGIRERGALDAFQGYEIWLGGTGRLTTIQDTFYVYSVTASRQYNFWIRAAYDGGFADTSNHYRVSVNLSADEPNVTIPEEFYLAQNFPNPFNPQTTIEFGLPRAADVTLDVYDVTGRTVATLVQGVQTAGRHRVTFDGSGSGTGIYFYRIRSAEYTELHKMLLLK